MLHSLILLCVAELSFPSEFEKHFLNIPNVFEKIKEGGIIIWNTKNYRDICGYILCLCGWRSFELKGKIYVINNEGILVHSKGGKSYIKTHKPCELCQEECKIRDKKRILF